MSYIFIKVGPVLGLVLGPALGGVLGPLLGDELGAPDLGGLVKN
jgi:hypothetical protein